MNKSEYTLIETKADNKWDKFVEDSPNGTIFSKSLYLNSSCVRYKLFYCYKKAELRAAVALIEDNLSSSLTRLDDFIIYNGIMYNKPTNKQNHAQQHSEQFKIQEYISTELTKKYKIIYMSLHPSIIDIRALLWVNYGKDLPKYSANIRYTSYIDISDFKDAKRLEDISIYNKASTSRRQQIRYAIKKGYTVKVMDDVELLIQFYKKTMNRQGLEVEEDRLIIMKKLSKKLIFNNKANIYVSYDDKGELGSMALFVWDSKRAYYLFGANEPSKRDGHSGTNVLWEAFYDLSKNGIKEVDLEGINSPARGWFKLSFGGDIIPYFEVCYG